MNNANDWLSNMTKLFVTPNKMDKVPFLKKQTIQLKTITLSDEILKPSTEVKYLEVTFETKFNFFGISSL